jgi:hypothetical protein
VLHLYARDRGIGGGMNRRALLGWMAALPFAPYLASAIREAGEPMLPVAAMRVPPDGTVRILRSPAPWYYEGWAWWNWDWNIDTLAARHIKR